MAIEAGTRALVYLVQAEAWGRLSGFASRLVNSMENPNLLNALIPHLQTAAESAPEGKPRWTYLCNLADALIGCGRPDASLPFYEQAGAQARAAAERGAAESELALVDLARINGNSAAALLATGDLGAARQKRLESENYFKMMSLPAIHAIGNEVEVLRIDILQERAEAALPKVEMLLTKIETWWRKCLAGESVPDAPNAAFLARVLIGAIDVAVQGHIAAEDWQSALQRIDAQLEIEQMINRPAEAIGATRMSRAIALGRIGHYSEAMVELETCLLLFQSDQRNLAKALGSLAFLHHQLGDYTQAISLERRALAMLEQMPEPADRAISHANLAIYLDGAESTTRFTESSKHQLAALLYLLSLGQYLQTLQRNYCASFHRAHETRTELTVPRMAILLEDPAFAALKQWLLQRRADLDELQRDADKFIDKARREAASR